MSYKRIVKKRGKSYGPYRYESYRDENGNVKKRYLGKLEKKKNNFILTLIVIALILIVGVIGYSTLFTEGGKKVFNSFVEQTINVGESFVNSFSELFGGQVTGRLIFDMEDFIFSNGSVEGCLEVILKNGELIPIDSKIVVEQNGSVREFAFSDFFQANTNGSYYVEGFELNGSGEGYGFEGSRIYYPEVHFTLVISDFDESSSSGEDSEIVGDNEDTTEEINETSDSVSENLEQNETVNDESEIELVEDPDAEEPAQQVVDLSEEEDSETSITEEIESPTENPSEESSSSDDSYDGSGSLITGEAVLNDEVEGIVSKDNPFEYNLVNQIASLKSGSVYVEGLDELDYVYLDIYNQNDKVIVSTDFNVTEEGFGEDYLGEQRRIKIECSDLQISAYEGIVNVKLIYGNEILAEATKNIVEGKVFPVNVTNETIKDFNFTETTLQYKAVINRPVKWVKKIKTNSSENVNVTLPRDAENITVKTGAEVDSVEEQIENYNVAFDKTDKQEIVGGSLITGNVALNIKEKSFFESLLSGVLRKMKITGNVVGDFEGEIISEDELVDEIVETDESKVVDLTRVVEEVLISEGNNETEVAVEYTTPAPMANETNISDGKRIVVHAEDELNYTEILSYTLIYDVPGMEQISINDSSKLKLYWYTTQADAIKYGYLVDNSSTTSKEVENSLELNNSETVEENASVETSNDSVEEILENESNFSITGNVVVALGDENLSDVVEELTLEEEVVSLLNSSNDLENGSFVKIEVDYVPYDFDEDGFVDYIEWVVPHLSAQVYEVIYTNLSSVNTSFIGSNYTHLQISESAPYDSLVGYWSFDADTSTTAYDLSGRNNHGTYTGNALPTEEGAIYEDALQLDGVGDYVNTGVDTIGVGNLTVSVWINPKTYGESAGRIFDNGRQTAYLTSDGRISFTGSNAVSTSSTYPSVVKYNTWQYVTIVRNSTGYTNIYVNGTDLTSTYNSGTPVPATTNLILGSNVGATRDFNGSIDEVMIFNTSLTEAQILEIYNNQSARFKSEGTTTAKQFNISAGSDNVNVSLTDYKRDMGSNLSVRIGEWDVSRGYNISDEGLVSYWTADGDANDELGVNNGTLVGDANANAGGVFGNAFGFDGAGDYVQVSGTYNPSEVTYSLWAYPKDNTRDYAKIFVDNSGYNDERIRIGQSNTDGALQVFNDYSLGFSATACSGFTNDNWHHIIVTISNSTQLAKIWLDGVNCANDTSFNSATTAGTTIQISASAEPSFNGSIDEVMIFNRSLSADEIKEIYVKGRALWNYSDWQNLTAVDSYDNVSSNIFGISTNTTNVLPEIKLFSDDYDFYTPFVTASVSSPMELVIEDTAAGDLSVYSPVADSTYGSEVPVNISASDDNDLFVFNDYGLVSWWRMEDTNQSEGTYGAKVVDYFGRNNGTAVGQASQSAIDGGKIGRSFEFDGAGDYVDLGSSTEIIGENATISVWMNSNYAATQNIYNTISTATNRVSISLTSTGRFQCQLTTGSGQGWATPSGTSYADGNWHNIIFIKNGGEISNSLVYVDGSPVLITSSGNLAFGLSNLIGASGTVTLASFFNGSIDEVMVFNRSLSAEEVAGLYANSSSKFCYDNETKVMTSDGWEYFKDVSLEDEIATLNSSTGEVEWHKPSEKQEFDSDGEMYSIETEKGNLVVSEEHKIYVKKKGSLFDRIGDLFFGLIKLVGGMFNE